MTAFHSDLTAPTPHSAYPSDIHRSQSYPWTIECSDESLVVRSKNCTHKISPTEAQCQPCSTLLTEDVISGSDEQNKNGIRDNTPYKWYTMADLIGLIQRKNAQINSLKLAGLNMARSLLARARHLEVHKCFLLVVS
jgi:hypothetical protein